MLGLDHNNLALLQMPLGHEQPDVPPQLYARGLDSAGTSSSAIIGRCVFCARQEHSLLPVYNAAPHVPPVDNAAAERLKKLKVSFFSTL